MTDTADRYRHLSERLTKVVDDVPPDAWDRPSPCEGWAARDVLAHVVTTEWEFLEQRGVAPDGVELDADPLVAWPVVRDTIQAVLDDPDRADAAYDGYFGPTTIARTIDTFYASDLLVHAWDIARATGLTDHEAMPADEVARVSDEMGALGDNVRQPGVYGPAVEVSEDADPQTKLLAFTGRNP